eukprot:scaffold498361_cov14-Prasinocladus_malaysianus.AAC.1
MDLALHGTTLMHCQKFGSVQLIGKVVESIGKLYVSVCARAYVCVSVRQATINGAMIKSVNVYNKSWLSVRKEDVDVVPTVTCTGRDIRSA